MSENKTITQLALDAGVETGGTENALAILKFAKSYADQEKRSTAIAFAGWTSRKGYINHGDMWDVGGGEYLSSGDLYDISTITP